MKRTILVVLMVFVVVTPCFAQEVEPEGMLSLHGTVWQVEPTWTILPYPGFFDDVFEARQRGDYTPMVTFEPEQLEEFLKRTEYFLREMENLFKGKR